MHYISNLKRGEAFLLKYKKIKKGVKNKMKNIVKEIFKSFSLILLIAMCILSTIDVQSLSNNHIYYTNGNNIGMLYIEYNNLLSQGFTEEQIFNMDKEEFERNKNLKGELMAIDIKYVETTYTYRPNDFATASINNIDDTTLISVVNREITEEEYNNIPEDMNTLMMTNDTNPDIVETTYKKITTTITYLSNGRYRFRNDLVWKIMPSNRSYDVFAIGTNSAVSEPVNGTEYAKTSYTVKDSCVLSSTSYSNTHSSNWKKLATGYGVSFKIPSNSTKTYTWNGLQGTTYPCKDNPTFPPLYGSKTATLDVTSLSSYMYYEVAKVGSSTTLSAFGTYQHSVQSISLSVSLDFGISITGNVGGTLTMTADVSSKFDGMAGTHAQVLNPIW